MYLFKRFVTTMSGKVYRPGVVVPNYFIAPQDMIKAGDIEEVIEIPDEKIPEAAEQIDTEPVEPAKRGRSKK